jgi:hypothetical protein
VHLQRYGADIISTPHPYTLAQCPC